MPKPSYKHVIADYLFLLLKKYSVELINACVRAEVE